MADRQPLDPDDIVTLNRLATVARLLSGAAHEVNNALQVISGTVELLEGRHDLSEGAVKSLQRVKVQTARAATALDDVMRFVRQSATLRTKVSLRDLVSQSVALRAFVVRRLGLSLTYTPPEEQLPVQGNPSQLQQVVLNLLTNAEQALAGRPGATILVEVGAEPPWGVVRVSDDGPGVQREVQGRLFDAFVTSRPRADSVGLGLTAAKAVAEAHGGTLVHESVDSGASFVLRIPLAD